MLLTIAFMSCLSEGEKKILLDPIPTSDMWHPYPIIPQLWHGLPVYQMNMRSDVLQNWNVLSSPEISNCSEIGSNLYTRLSYSSPNEDTQLVHVFRAHELPVSMHLNFLRVRQDDNKLGRLQIKRITSRRTYCESWWKRFLLKLMNIVISSPKWQYRKFDFSSNHCILYNVHVSISRDVDLFIFGRWKRTGITCHV